MNDKINLTNADGLMVNADIICFLENTETKKRYLYFTLNELVGNDANSTVKIYVSKIRQNDPILDTPITKEEWDVLKGYMADALKGVSTSQIKYLPLTELTDPVSVSDMAIAMPLSYDYISKHRGVYAQSVAIQPAETVSNASATVQEVSAPAEPAVNPGTSAEAPLNNTLESTPVPPVAPEVAPTVNLENTESMSTSTQDNLNPSLIDISDIEKKYDNMIADINRLKEQEIEAIKRYNATIELSSMHNEQHANYVQNAQSQENLTSVANPTPAESNSVVTPESAPSVEPTPVAPIVPEPVVSSTDVETNWFDLPANN